MKVYLIYDKTINSFIDKRPFHDGRKYLVYGDIRSARAMANNLKKMVLVGILANIKMMILL